MAVASLIYRPTPTLTSKAIRLLIAQAWLRSVKIGQRNFSAML
jgi:hypothetical protein